MKAIELQPNGEYYMITRRVTYNYRKGYRYWFTSIDGSFWMNERQIEDMLTAKPIQP